MGDNSRQLSIIISLKDQISAGLSGVADSLSGLEGKVSSMQPTFQKMAAYGTAATAALGYGILNAVNSYEQFDASIQRSGAFVNASADQLEQFRQAAVAAAQGTSFSFTQVADALGNFVGGSIDAKTATQDLGDIINLALVAKMQDLNQVADLASNSMQVFRSEGLKITDVMDSIATVAANVTTNTASYANALTQSAGAANASGLSFKDLNVVLSEMVSGGANVDDTWAAFNGAMNFVQAGSKSTKTELDKVGLSLGGLQTALRDGAIPFLDYLKQGYEKANESGQGFYFLTQVLGRQAAPEFAAALQQSGDQINSVAGYFDNAAGSGEALAQKMRDAVPATQKLQQQFATMQLQLGQALQPAFVAIVNVLIPVLDYVTKLAEEHPKLTAAIALSVISFTALVAIVGTIGLLLPAITAAVGVLAVAFSPLGLAIAGTIAVVGELIAIFYLLKDDSADIVLGLKAYWQEFADFFKGLWQDISSFFAGIWTTIESAAGTAIDWITSKLQPIVNLINTVKNGLSSIGNAASSVGGFIGNAVHAVIPAFAAGGIVTSPTLGLIGEAGPEAVIPLSQLGSMGAGITINVYGGVSGNELIQKVKDSLMQSLRSDSRFAI